MKPTILICLLACAGLAACEDDDETELMCKAGATMPECNPDGSAPDGGDGDDAGIDAPDATADASASDAAAPDADNADADVELPDATVADATLDAAPDATDGG